MMHNHDGGSRWRITMEDHDGGSRLTKMHDHNGGSRLMMIDEDDLSGHSSFHSKEARLS